MDEYQIGDRVVIKSTTGVRPAFLVGTIDSEPVENGYFVKIHPEFQAIFYYNTEIMTGLRKEHDGN